VLKEFDGNLFVEDGKISFSQGNKVEIPSNAQYIVPGFIDQHIHGVAGVDVMDNSVEAIKIMSESLVKEGTTSFCPTTMTYDLGEVRQSIDKCASVQVDGANIIGVHLEGPFISLDYKGAQNPIYLMDPNIEALKLLNLRKNIKIVTYAPELDPGYEFTKFLVDNNIIASVGHSGATCDVVNEAIELGLNNFTHFHNGTSGHHHREPGVVTSGLMNKDAKVELIVDGIHLHPTTVKAVYDIKGSENIILITDAMRAKGCQDGEYDLGGQTVVKDKNKATLKESGALAGSVLEMNQAIKNMLDFSKCSYEEAFKMASYNVAKHLKLDSKGEIAEGFDADITILDENLEVIKTIVSGEVKYEKKG
jgi:N-acetylglucosamine-6-phosphate deacetylase